MAWSRQFKALARISGFFAAAWGAVGVAAAALTAGLAASTLLTFGAAFASAGAISGVATALILAKGESGRSFDEIPTWRASLWGVLGGAAPAVVFGTLALIVTGNPGAIISVAGLGAFGAVVGGTIATVAHAGAKRSALPGSTPTGALSDGDAGVDADAAEPG